MLPLQVEEKLQLVIDYWARTAFLTKKILVSSDGINVEQINLFETLRQSWEVLLLESLPKTNFVGRKLEMYFHYVKYAKNILTTKVVTSLATEIPFSSTSWVRGWNSLIAFEKTNASKHTRAWHIWSQKNQFSCPKRCSTEIWARWTHRNLMEQLLSCH